METKLQIDGIHKIKNEFIAFFVICIIKEFEQN